MSSAIADVDWQPIEDSIGKTPEMMKTDIRKPKMFFVIVLFSLQTQQMSFVQNRDSQQWMQTWSFGKKFVPEGLFQEVP